MALYDCMHCSQFRTTKDSTYLPPNLSAERLPRQLRRERSEAMKRSRAVSELRAKRAVQYTLLGADHGARLCNDVGEEARNSSYA